jgi:predicted histone-like DNA-binding protein
MPILYLIRKKVFFSMGEKKTLWFAVQKKYQRKSGRTGKHLARIIAGRTTFTQGEVQGMLVELANVIGETLSAGMSVTIDGLGTFQTALTSTGFDTPEKVVPREVRLSRIYFKAGKELMKFVKKADVIRVPLSSYFPKSMLSKETLKEEE